MRRRWAAAAVVAALLGSTPLGSAASAAEVPFTVTHSATYESGMVPQGALLAIFTADRVSDEQYHAYNPWVSAADDGLRVAMSCSADRPFMDLPILFVGWSGKGNQVNVYAPNPSPPEPFGACDEQQTAQFRIYPHGDPAQLMTQTVSLVPLHPGLYGVTGGFAGDAVSGVHITPGGGQTQIADCNRLLPGDPSVCPVSVNGQSAELLLNMTGADSIRCNPCLAGFISILLTRIDNGKQVALNVTSVSGTGTPGVEQARVPLNSDVTAGEYRIQVWNFRTGTAVQDLRIEFGGPVTVP
jgi:hypothetical protein